MSILRNIEDRLMLMDLGENQEAIMRIIREETRPAIDVFESQMRLAATEIKEDKLNVIYVPTGIMSKSKAEEHMKKVASLFKEACPNHNRLLFMSYGTHDPAPVIHALEKDRAYLIQINTGYMPRPKADAFIKQQREILGNKLDAYNITVMGVNQVQSISVLERTDYGDNEESVIPSKS